MPNRVFVSLGSNIDKERNLPAAVRLLNDLCHVIVVSSAYETAPVGLERQPSFLNAAVLVETRLDAVHFRRQVLEQVERYLERIRTSDKNAPRTIDADITFFNEEVFELDREHHIPDPDFLRFPHVAIPIAELAPDMPHPETGETLTTIAQRLLKQAASKGVPPLKKRTDVLLDPSAET